MKGPVCLVIPPSPFLLDERVFVSLGVLRVAAVLERAGIPVEVLDLSGVSNYAEAAAAHFAGTDARAIGLTATTPQFPAAMEIAAAARNAVPRARLILGGPHGTLTMAACKQEMKGKVQGRAARAMQRILKAFDCVVTGDGEAAVFEALNPLSGSVVDGDDPRNGLFMDHAAYDASPWPARHLVEMDSYRYFIEGERATSLITQLGCPFNCGFCGGRNSASLRRIRLRSGENVVAELRHIHETYGLKGFMFYDDELNVNPKMAGLMHLIADLQEELGVSFKLRGFVKAELFTDEQAAAMRLAGFRWVLVGFESGSERILRNINKRSTREENTRCVEIARRHGLKVKALMSIGHPGESEETVRETRDWLLETAPEDFDATIITPYPGSPYFDQAVPSERKPGTWEYEFKGDRLYSHEVDYAVVADYYKGDPEDGYRAYVATDSMGPEDLVAARDALERDVRKTLGIPWNPASPAARVEHSMGQMPSSIFRRSDPRQPAAGGAAARKP